MNEDRAVNNETDVPIEPEPGRSIIVGHDRSAGAEAALTLALELASELRAPVTVVRAWSITSAPRPANWKFGYVSAVDELAKAVHAELADDTKNAVAALPEVVVTYRAYHAGPARSLIEASRNARLLVVGSRGLGGFAELVLGSVSDKCVRYARCPVLVARTPEEDTARIH